jgi:hypothetical protein
MKPIFQGSDSNKRWYDLVPETLKSHAPDWGNLPRSDFDPDNLVNFAPEARVKVDSFYSTVNTGDTAKLYPTLNQVEISHWLVNDDQVQLRLATHTPNFSHYSWRFDGLGWHTGIDSAIGWKLHGGQNRFEVQSVNKAGNQGRNSVLEIRMTDGHITETKLENGLADVPGITFLWEDFNHPTLVFLREKYGLDEIVHTGKSDLERAILLRDWLKSLWDHDQPIYSPPWDAAYILDKVTKKIEYFYCVHYSVAYMQLCLALGIPARLINLHRGICDAPFDGRGYGKEAKEEEPCDEHVLNEVWLDDLGKWVVMDVDFDIHYEKDEHPLNALEIHNLLLNDQLVKLQTCEGPYAHKLRSSDDFYQFKLPVYYTHFCLFWRNNHLSDPEGPTQILHYVDDRTPPMIWWQGEDLRHRPQIIGPIGVSWPYTQHTPVLNDMNAASHWASAEDPVPHWVELHWEEPQQIEHVHILWAKCWDRYFNSRHSQVQIKKDGVWETIAELQSNCEKAMDVISFPPVKTDIIRIVQPLHGGSPEFPDRFWIAEIGIN